MRRMAQLVEAAPALCHAPALQCDPTEPRQCTVALPVEALREPVMDMDAKPPRAVRYVGWLDSSPLGAHRLLRGLVRLDHEEDGSRREVQCISRQVFWHCDWRSTLSVAAVLVPHCWHTAFQK